MRELERLRDEVDRIDGQIVALLAERARTVDAIAAQKADLGLGVVDADRERRLLDRWIEAARASGLDEAVAEGVLEAVLEQSRARVRARVERADRAE